MHQNTRRVIDPASFAFILLSALAFLLLACADTWVRFSGPSQPGLSNVTSNSDGLFLTHESGDFQQNHPACAPHADAELCFWDRLLAINGRSVEELYAALLDPSAPRPPLTVGQSVTYTVVRDGQSMTIRETLIPFPTAAFMPKFWPHVLFMLFMVGLTTLVFCLQPNDPAARLMFLLAIAICSYFSIWALSWHSLDYLTGYNLWLYFANSIPLFSLCSLFPHFAYHLTRPDGPRLSARLLWLNYGLPYTLLGLGGGISFFFSPTLHLWFNMWLYGDYSGYLPLAYFALTVGIFVWNYAHAEARTRARLRAVVYAGGFSLLSTLTLIFAPDQLFGFPFVDKTVVLLLFLPLLFAIIYAIWRYEFFGIKRVVTRVLTYTIVIAVSYIGSLALSFGLEQVLHSLFGALFSSDTRATYSTFIAFALVILLAIPFRDRARRAAEQVVYGRGRSNPYAILDAITRMAKEVNGDDTLLTTLAQTIATAFKLPYVAIADADAPNSPIAAWGVADDRPFRLPLLYQAETVGHLIYAGRTPGEVLTRADQRNLDLFLARIGGIVYARQLADDLAHARQRIARARETAIGELRQRLHDVVGPEFAGLIYRLYAARTIRQTSATAADGILTDLQTDMEAIIPKIRDLSYDLLPPQSGLADALHERLGQRYPAQYGGTAAPVLRISTTPDPLPLLLSELEMDALHILLLAVANVIRHADATTCTLELTVRDATLYLNICDDGRGLPPEYRAGVGVTSMSERAARRGGRLTVERRPEGGTRVVAVLPCERRKDDDNADTGVRGG